MEHIKVCIRWMNCITKVVYLRDWNLREETHKSSSKNLKLYFLTKRNVQTLPWHTFWNYHPLVLPVDSRHLKECIERAEFSLNLELWFGEQQQTTTQQPDASPSDSPGTISDTNLMLASTRTLQLNFHPGRGLHYHLPVLFDYFHLAAVSLGIHASLIAMHQPYIK